MATEVASRQVVPPLPLYRMDVGTYNRLLQAGALDGLDVELLDGLLVDKHSQREDPIHRLDVAVLVRGVDAWDLPSLASGPRQAPAARQTSSHGIGARHGRRRLTRGGRPTEGGWVGLSDRGEDV